MFLSIEVIVKIVFEFGCDVNDIGFIDVQVVLLIVQINYLQGYFVEYKKDYYSCCGLLCMVFQCCKLFDYLKCKDVVCYIVLIECLGLCC